MAKGLEKKFQFGCRGRNSNWNEVLDKPVNVELKVCLNPGHTIYTISSSVDCPYATGRIYRKCKASHPNKDKPGDAVFCPYSVDTLPVNKLIDIVAGSILRGEI